MANAVVGTTLLAVVTGPMVVTPAQAATPPVVAQALTVPVAASQPAGGSTVTVVPGDTLGAIGKAHGEPWQTLYQNNTAVIGPNPNLIFPGQVFTLTAAATPAPAPAAGGTGTEHANITNSAGPVRPGTQAAADAVVSNVPGADRIVLGGTRASAIDPNGHPAGKAVDYMVGLGNISLGNAIVQYHIDHWAQLHVEYLIYRQRILLSPGGAWKPMENRGSPTANHMDHVHANYLG